MNELTSGALPQEMDMTHVAAPRPHFIAAPRRGVLAALAGGLLTRLPFGLIEAGAKGSGKHKKRNRS